MITQCPKTGRTCEVTGCAGCWKDSTTQDKIIRMARELATRHGSRMCDEDGETHGEELYCVGVEDIAEIIKQVAAHEREKAKAVFEELEREVNAELINAINGAVELEREACAKVCEGVGGSIYVSGRSQGADFCAAAIRIRGEK